MFSSNLPSYRVQFMRLASQFLRRSIRMSSDDNTKKRKRSTSTGASTDTNKATKSTDDDVPATTTPTRRYWIMKNEPEDFSYQRLEKEGKGIWDGVRNMQASKNLRTMKKGDLFMFYHSITEKACVGVGKIVREAFPDPTDETKKWVSVEVAPVKALKKPVILARIKAEPSFANLALVRQQRLSVMPATQAEWDKLLEMGNTTLDDE